MLDSSFISQLSTEHRDWLAEAIVGIAVADKSVVASELLYVRSIMACIDEKEEVDKLVCMLKTLEAPTLENLKIDREMAARIFLYLAEMAGIDNRLTQREADFLKYIGERLGFDKENINRVVLWTFEMVAIAKKNVELINKLKNTTPFYKNL